MRRQKRQVMRPLGMLLLFVVLLCLSSVSALAEGTAQVTLAVKYGQTEARSMLAMINEFRTGEDAWYWNSDDTTITKLTGLGRLTYDYDLERIAIRRAAEIAVSFSHTRPNGESCFTAVSNGTRSWGENIAAGYPSAASVFAGWKETEEDYSGQGHRRNMLRSGYTSVGIGHVYYNGCHFWVQEFGYANSGAAQTAAADNPGHIQVEVALDSVTGRLLTAEDCTVAYGSSVSAPKIQIQIQMADTWPYRPLPVIMDYTWTAADTGCISVSEGMVTGINVGTGRLTTTVLGETVTAQVTVTPLSLENAAVNLEASTYDYTGTAVVPRVQSVILDGRTLIPGTDYTISCTNNQKPGTASVKITGCGNYTGTADRNFTILCKHAYQSEITKEPTCSTPGSRTFTCSLCGDTYKETISATGAHEYGKPTFTWASDGTSAKASFVCASGGETKTLTAQISALASEGENIYTAVVTLNQKEYTSVKRIPVVRKGSIYTKGSLSYKVTKVSGKKGTATVQGAVKKKSTSLKIPATVTIGNVVLTVNAVGDNAFKGMTKLKTISVGGSVTKIGTGAFSGCTALQKVSGCAGVTSVGTKAFYKCTKLTTVGSVSGRVTLAKVKTIGTSAFAGCKAIKKVVLSSGSLTAVGSGAFQGCTAMTSFSASSAKLSRIGSKAFYGCTKLGTVTLKTTKLTQSSVGSSAFKNVKATCTFKVPSSRVSSYKTIFTARGAGSRIKVKK